MKPCYVQSVCVLLVSSNLAVLASKVFLLRRAFSYFLIVSLTCYSLNSLRVLCSSSLSAQVFMLPFAAFCTLFGCRFRCLSGLSLANSINLLSIVGDRTIIRVLDTCCLIDLHTLRGPRRITTLIQTNKHTNKMIVGLAWVRPNYNI